MEKESEPGPRSPLCCDGVGRIPASLARHQPWRASQACRPLVLPEPAGKREGQRAFGGPSVWPSVTSQKQTVPSGYVPHVPKMAEVQQRQWESGPACWMLFLSVPAPPPTRR